MTFSGEMRVYFNSHGARPLVWCVATDAWELAVTSVVFEDVSMDAVYRPKAENDDDDGKPSAWFELLGTLRVSGSVATITAWMPARP